MKNLSIILVFFLLTISSFSQETYYKSYSWDENPIKHIVPEQEKDIICYKDKAVTEFIYEDGNLIEYFLIHKIYWLNSDDRIEEFNKIYLPYSQTSELVINKARVISKEGLINELDDSKIFTAKNEENNSEYKYYAFEGLQKGSFIEYYYVLKRLPEYDGKRLSFQSDFKKYNVDFELYGPRNLWFKFKSYNEIDSVKYDSTFTEKFKWTMHMDTLSALEKESQAPYEALRGYIVYNLYYNGSTKTYDLTSYKNIAQNLYDFYYAVLDKKVIKDLSKIIADLKINNELDEERKIRILEDYIKQNYFILNLSNPEYKNLSSILDKKVGSNQGIMKLYISFFETLKIQHEIVITSDRSQDRFDKDFESYNFLNDYMLYFPTINKYTSPLELTSRLGYPEPLNTNNYGLFVKQIQVGEFKTSVGKIKYIEPIDHTKTFNNLKINVKFNENDLTETLLAVNQQLGGYYSANFHPLFNLLKQEDIDEFLDEQLKSMSKEITITSKKTENEQPENFGYEPFTIIADITSEAFVEKAGNKYLFKVGELIGPQQEMYQEKSRKLVLENDFKRTYHREINIEIPEGFSITNLNSININNVFKENEKVLFTFISSYTLNGNSLTINCEEYYTTLEIPVTLYENYRKVINSAADFNKLTLILEPKN